MSAAVSHPSYFIWWYAYCSNQSSGSAQEKKPSWRHAFIRFSGNGLVLETLVPSAHHLHKGSELHYDSGGAAEHQQISLSSENEGDLILGEELNQVAMKRLQCAVEHSVLIQNAASSALVEFRNANERKEFVNYAAQLILQAHANLMSVTKRSPPPQKAVILAPKESPSSLKFQSKLTSAERSISDYQSRILYETSPKHYVKVDLEDLSRSTSNAHQALNKLTQHLQTAIHKSHVPGNALAYSSGDDEDIGGWDYWGFVPREQHVNAPSNHLASTAPSFDSPAALATPWQEGSSFVSSKKGSTGTTPTQHSEHLVSHGTQTSAVYQTMMSKLLPKEAASSSQSVRAKMRIPKSQLERNSFTEMTSDWEKTLRSHMPVPNRAVSPHSPRRQASPPKSPRNVQFSATTQFVSSQVAVDALLSDEAPPKVRSSTENSKLASSLSPKRFSPANNHKPEGSYAEWFEKKRAALALVGSMSFREKKSSVNITSNKTSPYKGGKVLNSRNDSKASRKESPHTSRGDSFVSFDMQSSSQSKSSGYSNQSKPRSNSAPKERKSVVTTPPRVWRIPDLDHHNSEASESTPKVVKHRSVNYGNGNISIVQPKSAIKSQNPQAVGKMSPQFFQLNQDDFVELISARESTLSPSFNHRKDPINRQVLSAEKDSGSSEAGPPAFQKQRRFSVFTQKKIAKLEPEISSYMASPEFQSLPVRLQKAFAIGQKNLKQKDNHSQRLFKP